MKRFFIAALLLTATLGANAQLHIGVKGGLNVSDISGFKTYNNGSGDIEWDGVENMDARAGFHAGIVAQYMFSPHIGIESGLYYSQLGANGVGKNNHVDQEGHVLGLADIHMTANYIQMPMLFIYKFNFRSGLSLYPSGGMYLGYGVGGKKELSFNYASLSVKRDFFNERTNKFDMGLSMGVNLEYKKFLFGTSFEGGLVSINKNKQTNLDYSHDDNYLFNQCFKVSVGYLFK